MKKQIRKELKNYLDSKVEKGDLHIFDKVVNFIKKDRKKQLAISDVSKSLPTEDAKFIYSLLPDWVKSKAPEGLHPTMYGTLSKEGDDEIHERVKQILGNVSNSFCFHTMTRNPKEHQENRCRLCKKPYKK